MYDLLKLAATESSFIFDDKLNKQIYRVATGLSFGRTLAKDFFCHYEKFGLMNVLLNLNLQFRDVTSTIFFVLFKSKEDVKLCVNYMKSKHENINFTIESEDSR